MAVDHHLLQCLEDHDTRLIDVALQIFFIKVCCVPDMCPFLHFPSLLGKMEIWKRPKRLDGFLSYQKGESITRGWSSKLEDRREGGTGEPWVPREGSVRGEPEGRLGQTRSSRYEGNSPRAAPPLPPLRPQPGLSSGAATAPVLFPWRQAARGPLQT